MVLEDVKGLEREHHEVGSIELDGTNGGGSELYGTNKKVQYELEPIPVWQGQAGLSRFLRAAKWPSRVATSTRGSPLAVAPVAIFEDSKR